MLSTETKGAAEFLARLSTAGTRLPVELAELMARLQIFGPELGRRARVTANDSFSILRVGCQRPLEAEPVRGRRSTIELSTESSSSLHEHFLGGPRDDDLLHLRAAGVGLAALESLGTWLEVLSPRRLSAGYSCVRTGDSETYLLHTLLENRDPEQVEESVCRVLTVAALVGVTEAQKTLLSQIYPSLARNQSVLVSLSSSPARALPQLRLWFPSLALAQVAKLLAAVFGDKGRAEALGHFAGAFDAERADSLTLIFGDQEPLLAEVSVEVAQL